MRALDADFAPRFSRRPGPPRAPAPAPSLWQWMAARLHADLTDPVRVDWYRNRHVVTAMRGIEITIRRRARRIDVRGRCDPAQGGWIDGNLDLRRPLHGYHWAVAWWIASQAFLPSSLRREAARWSMDEVSARVNDEARRSGLLPAARRRLLESLALDTGLWRRCQSMCRGSTFSSREFSLVWRQARRSRQVPPTLLSLFGVLLQFHGAWTRLSPEVLHWEFRRQRMSRRGWALLCRFGAALWWPLRHCHEFHRDPVSLITTWVNLIAATGRRDVPPATLALAFGRLHSMGQGSARADNGWTILVDRAWKQLDALPGGSARAAFARGPLEAVFVWWHVARVTTRLPRNVGWKWLQRSAANARLVDGGAAVAWRSFGDFARVGRYRVEPLRTLAAVRRAGIELHNCMSQATAAEGAAAKSVLFVLRHGASGRAVAMFTVRPARLGRVVVTMARGPCNLPVPEAHHRAMEAYLRGLNWLAWVQKHCKS